MATKPGSGDRNQPTQNPSRNGGWSQDERRNIPDRGREQVNQRDTTVSRVQPRRDGGGGGGGSSGGGSKGG